MSVTFAARRLPALLLVLLVALALVRSAVGTRLDGFTIDEPWHVVAGIAYARHGDFSLNPEHPPLAKRWAAAFMDEGFVLPPAPPLSEKADERAYVEQVVYADNDDRAVQNRLRLAMWAFHALALAALGLLLWRALGAPWALGTLAFLALEPTVAANLPLLMTDLPVALTLTCSAVALGLLLARWRWRWALLLGVAMGAALGSKHSALAGLGALALLAVAGWLWQLPAVSTRERLRRALQLVVSGVLALTLLWAQYDFRFAPRADGGEAFNRPLSGKLADLDGAFAAEGIAVADRLQLLPRAYLWGLADTLRVGVVGRGEPGNLLWGEFVPGAPPWYAWPSLLLVKLPLPLLAMGLLGALALWRLPLPPPARWTLAALVAMGLGHGSALYASASLYAGVRHALPLVPLLAVLAGALVAQAWSSPRPALRALALSPLLLAASFTLGEPRLWEYHNELAGGSAGAHRLFDNEGLDIGQRQREIFAYAEQHVAPTGKPLYRLYSGNSALASRASFRYRRHVESIADDNRAGVFDGFFVIRTSARVPAPQFSYDPTEMLAGLVPQARFGNVEIWRGRQVQPKVRLGGLFGSLMRYVYRDGGDDWALVAARAQEIVDAFPQHAPAAIELGNAWLRLGERKRAREAYATPLGQQVLAVEAGTREQLQAQLALLDGPTPIEHIVPLRNRAME